MSLRSLALLACLGPVLAGSAYSQAARLSPSRLEGSLAQAEAARRAAVEEAADGRVGAVSGRVGPTFWTLWDVRNGHPIFRATHNAGVAISVRVPDVRSGGWVGLDLQGIGQTVGVWDAETALPTHDELIGRVTVADGSRPSSHATHVTGTIAASGARPEAMGIAPGAQILAYDWQNDTVEMAGAGRSGLFVSNHSYGSFGGWVFDLQRTGRWAWTGDPRVSEVEDFRYGYYGDDAAAWDAIAFASPEYVIVKSAGNERADKGPAAGTPHDVFDGGWTISTAAREPDGGATGFDTILDSGVSKNVLTIGAVEDLPGEYTGPSDVRMSGFSGWGPTDDGRIKPDLVANGTSVFSSVSGSPSSYAYSSGTSMSAPAAAGVVALLQEAHQGLVGAVPSSASIRAILIHTADEAGPAPGPDYQFGWGLINAGRAASLISSHATSNDRILTGRIEPGQTLSYEFDVPPGYRIEATLAWTDPPADPRAPGLNQRSPLLVSDLDLRVSGAEGLLFPYVLDPERPAYPAATGPNSVDNVERVVGSSRLGGEYEIRVSMPTGTPDGQDFALVLGEAATGMTLGNWLAGKVTIDGSGIQGVPVRAGSSEAVSAADGTFLFPNLPPGMVDVVPDPFYGFFPDTLRLEGGQNRFVLFEATSTARLDGAQFFSSPDLLRTNEWEHRSEVDTPASGGVYGLNVFVESVGGVDLSGGRLVLDFGAHPRTASYAGSRAEAFASTGSNYRLTRIAERKFFQRIPMVWMSPDPPGEDVQIPARISDYRGRLVGLDTLRFRVDRTDDVPPLIYPRIDVEGRGLALRGQEIILRADIVDASRPTSLVAELRDRDHGGFLGSVPLYDDGHWTAHGDAVPGDRLVGGIYRPTSIADFRVDFRASDEFGNQASLPGGWHFTSRPYARTAPYLLLTWSQTSTDTDLYRRELEAAGVRFDWWEFDLRSQIPDTLAVAYEGVVWAWASRPVDRPDDHALFAALNAAGVPVVLLGSRLQAGGWLASEIGVSGQLVSASGDLNGVAADTLWSGVHLQLSADSEIIAWSGADPVLAAGSRAVGVRRENVFVAGFGAKHLRPADRAPFLRRALYTVTRDPELAGVFTGLTPTRPLSPSISAPWPNPGSEDIRFLVAISGPVEVTAELFDLLGRRVSTTRWLRDAGRHVLPMDASRLPAGVYVLRIRAAAESSSFPLVIAR